MYILNRGNKITVLQKHVNKNKIEILLGEQVNFFLEYGFYIVDGTNLSYVEFTSVEIEENIYGFSYTFDAIRNESVISF